MQRVRILADIVEPTTAARWVALAERVTVTELERAKQWAIDESTDVVFAAYDLAIEAAAPHDDGEARIRVASKKSQRDPKPPKVMFLQPGQVRAARWFVDHVRIPPRHGFGKVVERDRFVCQNPRCGAQCMRNQAHHLEFRSQGGSDHPHNGCTVCPACHLRGVHSWRLSVDRVEGGLLWRYPDGERVFVVDPGGAP